MQAHYEGTGMESDVIRGQLSPDIFRLSDDERQTANNLLIEMVVYIFLRDILSSKNLRPVSFQVSN